MTLMHQMKSFKSSQIVEVQDNRANFLRKKGPPPSEIGISRRGISILKSLQNLLDCKKFSYLPLCFLDTLPFPTQYPLFISRWSH